MDWPVPPDSPAMLPEESPLVELDPAELLASLPVLESQASGSSPAPELSQEQCLESRREQSPEWRVLLQELFPESPVQPLDQELSPESYPVPPAQYQERLPAQCWYSRLAAL